VQLHGDEPIADLLALNAHNIKIIKVFRIDANFDWESVQEYAEFVHYFLFDTASENYGGSGQKFNWEALKNYTLETPFFLSNGIGVEDVPALKKLKIPQLYGVDINIKFEIEPGKKNIELVKTMINQMKDERTIHHK